MAVRKTESTIPQTLGFTIDDLGEHATSTTSPQVKIVSYLTSPLGVNLLQNYVVFVEDSTLRPNVASYEWIFNNNGTITNSTTTNGVASFRPNVVGTLSVTVNLKNSANATLHTVVLQQQVAALNLELEQLIDQEGTSSPSAGNPTVSREVINGLRIYADAAADPVTDNALNRLLLSSIYSNISANNATQRNTRLESCSAALETAPNTFFTTAQNGIGITKLRSHLAAMFILDGGNPLIAVTERPAGANAAQISATTTTIQTAFNGMTEPRRIELFNLLRFPKSNIKISKLVLDGLKTRYFSTEAVAGVLGNRNKARRLISEYEVGPYVPPASGSADLTGSSTSIFNLMLMPVWRISVSAATNAAGTIDPQTRLFGIPEPIPEKTYMADTGIFPGDAQFINEGRAYHQNFNISFTTVVSIEEIINDLQSNSTFFNHFRIFTHANESLLGISMFRGGAGFVRASHLDGFNISELRGVIGILGAFFGGTYVFAPDIANDFLNFLRGQNNPALVPFHLDNASAPLSGDLRELFRRYIDIWLVRIPGSIEVRTGANSRNLTAAEIADPFEAFLNLIVRLLRPSITASIAGLTDAHFTALRTAILAVTPVDVGYAPGGVPYNWIFRDDPSPNNQFPLMIRDLRSVVTALPAGNTFMTKLAHVKNNRFNASSFVDIRGCLAGKLPIGASPPPPFLLSLQRFFGRTGALPTVTAPDWFQSFNADFTNGPMAGNAGIDNVFSNGFSNAGIVLTGREVSDSFDEWSRRSNLDDQFTFFTNLFPATPDLIEFASLSWRSWRTTGSTTGIPPLNLQSSRADDMVQLSLGDLLNRLRENFSATAANLAPAVVTRLNALPPRITDLRQINADLTAFTGADFSPFYTRLSTLATQILGIPGMPAATTPLIDATAPAGLNRTHITGYVGNFRTYLTNSLTTDIGAVFSNIRTAISAPNAKRHYYFNIRLPLRVHTVLAASPNIVSYVVLYLAGAAQDAIRSYMKCQWTGTPSQIADMHSFIDGLTIVDGSLTRLRTGILTETETSATPHAFAPLPEYDLHIKHT